MRKVVGAPSLNRFVAKFGTGSPRNECNRFDCNSLHCFLYLDISEPDYPSNIEHWDFDWYSKFVKYHALDSIDEQFQSLVCSQGRWAFVEVFWAWLASHGSPNFHPKFCSSKRNWAIYSSDYKVVCERALLVVWRSVSAWSVVLNVQYPSESSFVTKSYLSMIKWMQENNRRWTELCTWQRFISAHSMETEKWCLLLARM